MQDGVRKSRGAAGRGTRLFVLASILGPFTIFLGAAWLFHGIVLSAARDQVLANERMLTEHAESVLDMTRLVLARVADRAEPLSWEQRRASDSLHRFLRALDDELPQLEAVTLIDPDGIVTSSSRGFPLPRIDVHDREAFQAASAGRAGLHVSHPFISRIALTPAVTVSRGINNRNAAEGVVVVNWSPAYFEDVYASILKTARRAGAALLLEDGTAIAGYPADRSAIAAGNPVLREIVAGGAGLLEDISPLNGRPSLIAYKRLSTPSLILVTTLDRSDILRRWYEGVGVLLLFTCLASASLLVAARNVLAAERRQRIQWRRFLKESGRRASAERELIHLQKMESVGRATGSLAHDFNNLLTALLGTLDLARKRVTDPTVAHLLDQADGAARRGTELTRQLLAFSRKDTPPMVRLDINEIVSETSDLLRRVAGAGVALKLDLDPEAPPAFAERLQLEVGLLNLVANARDAMANRPGTITIRTRRVARTADADRRALPDCDCLRIVVEDDGDGMDEGTRARALEPFFTTKPVGKGTGLGLPAVQDFVRRAGGAMTIDSAPGRGTVVSIYLRCETEEMPLPVPA